VETVGFLVVSLEGPREVLALIHHELGARECLRFDLKAGPARHLDAEFLQRLHLKRLRQKGVGAHPDYYSHVYIEYMHQLSTPVAYLSSLNLIDPFTVRAGRMPAHLGSPAEGWKGSYLYLTYDGLWVASFWGSGSLGLRRGFVADSQGPSRKYSGIEHYGYACIMNLPPGDPYFAWLSGITQGIDGGLPIHAKEDVLYNPTNGTTSFGGIARYGGDIPGCPQSLGG
jgi:hypothetical protein